MKFDPLALLIAFALGCAAALREPKPVPPPGAVASGRSAAEPAYRAIASTTIVAPGGMSFQYVSTSPTTLTPTPTTLAIVMVRPKERA